MTTLTIGMTGVPYRLAIERGKVREFATATKATDPSYWRDDAPLAPPTFLVSAAFWTEDGSSVLEQAGLDWGRLLSGGTEFVFHGPPVRAGENLTATQRVDDVYVKRGRRGGTLTFTVFSTRFRRDDGSLAAEEHHVTIETSRPAKAGVVAPDATVGTRAAGRPGALPTGPVAALTTLPEFVDEPVTRSGIVRYQGASGDLNPIHHDDEFARQAGYPGVFSVGMYHAGILGSYLADLFGPDAVRRFKVEFREQVWPGDVLTYRGTVATRRGGELELDLSAVLPGGETHLRAWATVAHRR